MKQRAAALLLVLCLLSGTAAGAFASEAPGKIITLMVYMCGSNLESGSGAATADLLEMAGSGYDAKKVNLLVMTGGTSSWQMNLPTDALCVYVPFRNTLRMVYAFESMSMGSSEALAALLAFGAEKYPADEYALIFWNHGGGPMNGVCWDELYDSDHLTMEELHGALSSSAFARQKLSWIGFDACLMASAETAFLMAPYADYMIASEETEPAGGWDYSFLKDLEKDPDAPATARRIIDGYFASDSQESKMTLSCIDLSKMQALSDSMDAFFEGLEVDGGSYAWFSYAARSTRAFGATVSAGSSYDLMDLAGLVRRLESQAPEKAEAVLRAVEDAVVYSRSGTGEEFGLSVYHPVQNKHEYAAGWAELYPQLGFSAGYGSYVTRFAEYLLGQAAGLQWDGLRAAWTEQEGLYALPLSDAQREMLSSAAMYVLRWDSAENTYTLISTGSRQAETDGVIYARDEGQILVAADENGTPLTGALPWEYLPDGSIAVYANFCRESVAETAAACELPAPGSGTGRKEFGSYSFDDQGTGTVTMNQANDQPQVALEGSELPGGTVAQAGTSGLWEEIAPVTASDVSPLRNEDYIETLAVPVSAFQDLLLSASSGPAVYLPMSSTVPIQPVQISAAVLSSRELGMLSRTGYTIPLDSFATVELTSFRPDQREVDLTQFDPEAAAQKQAPDLIHAQLILEAGEGGELRLREIQVYEPLNGEWTTRMAARAEEYPVLAFPVERKQPARAGDALAGFSRWTAAGSDAYRIPNGGLRLRFIPDPDSRQGACILFEVTDIQSNTYAAEPVMCTQ